MIDPSHDVRAVSMAGNAIAELRVDLVSTSGTELKRAIAQAAGFPGFAVKLLLLSGAEIASGDTSLLHQVPVTDREGGRIDVCCVLSAPEPFGIKGLDKGLYSKTFSRKAGMLLQRRIESAERMGEPGFISTHRLPEPTLRSEAQQLIRDSFAKYLAPLINLALQAAYDAAIPPPPAVAVGAEVSLGVPAQDGVADALALDPNFTYLCKESGSVAHLGACRLWTRALAEQSPLLQEDVRASRGRGNGRIVNAVLWRLLFGWSGCEANREGRQVPAGPVLEVLFLASHRSMRESGEALKLVQDLEEAALGLGCAAIAVAAVPGQGMSFWLRGCGFVVEVPLREGDAGTQGSSPDDGDAGAALGPDEPSSELGRFLRERMLVFADTPLVAKVLT